MSISVVTAFRNEGIQVKKTIESLLSTLKDGQSVELICVNDCSDDEYDYESDLNQFHNLKYISPERRVGSSAGKELGVQSATNEMVLLIDAHMRFLDNNWYDAIQSELSKNLKRLYCLYTIGFNEETEELEELTHSCSYATTSNKCVFRAKWSGKHLDDGPLTRVAVLMGASYFFNKSYWNYLKGLQGLKLYGREEEFMSIKSWGIGDGCYLLKNVKIAHMFRKVAPQPITTKEVWYNTAIICETLFPKWLRNDIYNRMRKTYPSVYKKVITLVENERGQIKELRDYLLYCGFDFSRFSAINIQSKINNKYEEIEW